jgi:modulator of FtsH protease HflC
MKRSLPSLIAGTLLVVILGLYMVTYQVRFTERAVVKTFGKATEQNVITEPGLYWKWPWPIQQVAIYDNRIQVTPNPGEETPTQDGKPIIVATACSWRITDPYLFNRTCGSIKDAAERLRTLVRNDQKSVISSYDFRHFVSTESQELKYDQIEQEVLAAVRAKAKDLYGIQVESISIDRLALPQRITENVFEAMKQERKALAARYTSEGDSQAAQIKATAEGIANTILAFADRKASEIVNEGLRQANSYNQVFRQDEALATFLLKVDNLPRLLKEKSTTLVLDQHSPLLDLLFAPATTQPAADATFVGKAPTERVSDATPEMIQPK